MKKSSKYSGRKLIKPDMQKEKNFTQIPNTFILNPEIGDPELRLLLYIMTNKDNYEIKTAICMMYLDKSKPPITRAFEKLIALGILIITDDIIEVVIPEEMKKYKIGYLKGNDQSSLEVKKTIPSETKETTIKGKDNFTKEVKKTLPLSNENYTKKVKKTYKIPLESIDIDDVTSPITLNNTRVLPVPAKSGSTEQSHSNDNTKGNTGIKLDLECGSLQSLAAPAVLAPSLHTPKGESELDSKELSLPIDDRDSKQIPIKVEPKPIEEELTNPTVKIQPHIQNSLPILFEKSQGLQLAFQNSSLTIEDFSDFSDSHIANVYLSIKLAKKDFKLKSLNYNPKHYGVYVYAGRSALEIEFETELKKQLVNQSKMSANELYKLIYGY